MNYDVKKLFVGLVEYYKNNALVFDTHVLYNDMNLEELYDLNLDKSILPYGFEEKYYKKSLVSFNLLLDHSKINYGHLSYEDALKIKHYYNDYYFKLLKCMNINTIDDLEESKGKMKSKRKQ